jgi:hypothetical protein
MQAPLHSLNPVSQANPHMPPMQVGWAFATLVVHWLLQPPQLFTSVAVFVSHPFVTSLSQLANVPTQVSITHTPLSQWTVATFGSAVQSVAQAPQCSSSVCRFASQPVVSASLVVGATVSQLAKPALQV